MLFFYTYNGDSMKIYLDLILILNFSFDLLLLLSVGLILRRKINFYRLIIASFIGGLSVLLLFFPLNSYSLFIIKIGISMVMTIICFSYKSLKYTLYNLGYLYINSIILGGLLYFLNISFSYKNEGLVFYNNGMSINFIVLIIASPIILYLYIKQIKRIKMIYSNCTDIRIYINDRYIDCIGFYDSGNNLKYKKKPVILIDKRKLLFEIKEFQLMPYQALNYTGILKIVKIDSLVIKERVINNIYLGIMDNYLNIDGVDVLLNNCLMEG